MCKQVWDTQDDETETFFLTFLYLPVEEFRAILLILHGIVITYEAKTPIPEVNYRLPCDYKVTTTIIQFSMKLLDGDHITHTYGNGYSLP